MIVDIDNVFDQIVNIQINNPEVHALKDLKLDLKDEYVLSMSYEDAYNYLCECLLIDKEGNSRQKLLDLFLVHQYLCHCYLSEEAIDYLIKDLAEIETYAMIIKECFSCYRAVGAFRMCIEQYEILRESNLWLILTNTDKMQIMKESAKSYRNTGDFYHALSVYYECLELNSEHDWLQRVELLLKIGKVYRNYLKQIELAKAYVEEAYIVFKEKGIQELNGEKERRYAVICLDTLGQIYRDEQDYGRAKDFFEKSIELYGKKRGRAYIHQILMKYQKNMEYVESDLEKDINCLIEIIADLEKSSIDEVGIGIRSVQLGKLKFKSHLWDKEEAYEEVYKGREMAYRYNDIKTVIRSYIVEANFLKQEKRYDDYIKVSKVAISLASSNNQLVLENEIIKEVIELSNAAPDIIDSATKIELIKHRKDIYKKLVEYSKLSIDILQKGNFDLFSKDKLIDIYGIVLDDFEQILGELSSIIEILNLEIDKINQKHFAYLNTEIKGFTYKSILHKFKNDLPDEATINQLRFMCEGKQLNQQENSDILSKVSKQLEIFANIIAHIKESAIETLKESEYEKNWCSLDKLIQTGIQNFIYYKPKYESIIKYSHAEQNVKILVHSTLFETTISEILYNAFDYVESIVGEKEIERKFLFYIRIKVVEKRFVVLKCYSKYWDYESAGKAEMSIRSGLECKKSVKMKGSRYGFYSIKFLFEELLGGQIRIIKEGNKVGMSIHLPINLVMLKIEEGDKIYE